MIKSYSQRITPHYSGLVQIVETDKARAMSMDGMSWEFYFMHTVPGDGNKPDRHYQRRYSPVALIDSQEIKNIAEQSSPESRQMDERVLELIMFIASAELPFPSVDKFEFWLLDAEDKSPLALIFSCSDRDQMEAFPNKTEWTALPDAVMHIQKTPQELEDSSPPVNHRFERLIAERAGYYPKAQWFERHAAETETFPPLLVKEDWERDDEMDLCRRYIQRQSTRLLMLQGLQQDDRRRLEIAAKPHVFEAERFFACYPEVVDDKLMNAIRVEARLRRDESEESYVAKRRDGIHYM
jgi:hypothetical protein